MAGPPLHTPRHDHLGEQLPIHWREFKNLQQPWLVEHALKTYGIPLLHDGSPLIDARLLDPDGLKTTLATIEDEPGGTVTR
ncbi:hypothetical protein GCM10010411_77260 [Actinomadura fulvescens]|uniref:Uncharacterized protein n=1 Tax=Actinomadura fulvescens TaxID=46160 RepID=A0ABP6CXQ3_9ACTN